MRPFYEHQENASIATARWTFVMVLAVLGTILVSGGVVTYFVAIFMYVDGIDLSSHSTRLVGVFGGVSLGIALVVVAGTITKTLQLRAGGKVVAEDVGGRLITEPRTADERCLLNIVEEISVASGIPTPPVYLLGLCDGINAFAAGPNPQEAVLAVTQGAVRNLNREQLQGVIAHEYAHILNGDMALNLKMIGWLHGVLSITILADKLIAGGCDELFGRRRSSFLEKDNSLAAIVWILVGCGLWPVGLIGTFMALLAKAATSRQREFLADAYAVQFTRHPEALADAFKRLAGHEAGSRVRSPRALEVSHMFFAEGCGSLARLLASHPPLVDRVLRLDPTWDGTPLFAEESGIGEFKGAFAGALGLVSSSGQGASTDQSESSEGQAGRRDDRVQKVPEMAAATAFIEGIRESLPDPLLQIVSARGGPSLILYGLWVAYSGHESGASAIPSTIPSVIPSVIPQELHRQIGTLVPHLRSMNSAQQAMLLDKAIDALTLLTGSERQELRDVCQQLVDACESDNLFHWMWNANLSAALGFAEEAKPRFGTLTQVEGACEVVLSRVSYASGSAAVAGYSFQRGLANLSLENIALLPAEDCCWETFEMAVELISQLAADPRRQMLAACSAALSSDQNITSDESFLIRGICRRLGYAAPTVLAGQPVLPGT